MFENIRFYVKHSVNDLRVNGQRTFFALLCIAAGVAAIVSLQTLAVMIQSSLVGSLQESNRGDIQLQADSEFMGQRRRGQSSGRGRAAGQADAVDFRAAAGQLSDQRRAGFRRFRPGWTRIIPGRRRSPIASRWPIRSASFSAAETERLWSLPATGSGGESGRSAADRSATSIRSMGRSPLRTAAARRIDHGADRRGPERAGRADAERQRRRYRQDQRVGCRFHLCAALSKRRRKSKIPPRIRCCRCSAFTTWTKAPLRCSRTSSRRRT